MAATIPDQMTPETCRRCSAIGARTLEELDEATRDRDIVSGPHHRDLSGYGRQYYAYVRATDAERRQSALVSAAEIKKWQKEWGWRVSMIGPSYVAEIAADCEELGIPVDFDLEDDAA